MVYGIIGYAPLLVLIFSINSPVPVRSNKMTLVRSMYMVPGVICFLLIAGSGVNFTIDNGTETKTEYTINGTSGDYITNSTTTITHDNQFTLLNPIWIMLHWLFAAILILYILTQILQMFKEPN